MTGSKRLRAMDIRISQEVCPRMKPATSFRCRILRGLAAGLATLSLSVGAGPLPAPVRAEIDGLLAQLEISGCAFQRNGKWYKAADAKAHLLRKLGYLEDEDLVRTTEQFIELGASTSSSSGKAYLVKCGDSPPVESGRWLLEMLKSMRGRAR